MIKLLDRPDPQQQAETLLMTTRETARALHISERKLFDLTFPRGTLRAVKLPGKVLYARQTIVEWIAAQESGSCEGSAVPV